MIKAGSIAACLLCVSAPAFAAATLSVPLELGPNSEITTTIYACDNQTFSVQYINTANNNLALIQIDGKERVFVNVIAGSGARYVAGEYEWWTKGNTANFSNTMKEGSTQECVSREAPSRN